MDEKEVKDTTNQENNNLVVEDTNDNLVEVVENENLEVDADNDQKQNNSYPQSTNKLTAFVYMVIFISILIWVYFYVTQNNNEILNNITGKDDTNQVETGSIIEEETNPITSSEVEANNTNIESDNTESDSLKEENIDNEKDPATSTTTSTSETWSKSEEVIIKDFEKELDSLFDIIDENAK